MEQYFTTIIEDNRHERCLLLLLGLAEPDILRQSKFTGHAIDIIKNLALENLYRQRVLKETIALDLLEKRFSDLKRSTYSNLNEKPELLKKKTRDDEIKNLKHQTEEHDHENILKSFKLANEFYKNG